MPDRSLVPPRAASPLRSPRAAQLASLSVLLLAAGAAAQTVTVGLAGSGAMFTNIQDGIDAVAPGGTVLVAAGDFVTTQPLLVDKPLVLLGAGRGQTRHTLDATSTVGAVTGIEITAIGTGEQAVVGGLSVLVLPPTGSAAGITIANCGGVVQLFDVNCAHSSTPQSSSLGAVQVRDAAVVTMDGCAFVALSASGDTSPPASALLVERSLVLVNDCFLGGGGQILLFGPVPVHDGAPALNAVDSVVRIARSVLRGGPGSTNLNAPAAPIASDGGAGVRAIGSDVRLRGGPGNEVRGGRGGAAPLGTQIGLGAPALALDAASFCARTNDVLLFAGADGDNQVTAPPIAGQGIVSLVPNPLVTANVEPNLVEPGETVTITSNGEAGAVALPLLALGAAAPALLPGVLGVIALDGASLQPLSPAILGPIGAASQVLTLPANPALAGVVANVQVLTFAPSGLVSIAEPCLFAVR